jgi:porphobilinogen synthase
LNSRPARLRKKGRGKLVRETTLLPRDLICPLFVDENAQEPVAIPSLPGFYRHTVETAVSEVEAIMELGIPAVIIFGVPREKDETGSSALSGIVQDTIRAIKTNVSDAKVIADVCLCDYTTDGWCGINDSEEILDAPTLEMLQRIAASYARAGVDIVAPSAMIDGMVGAIRSKLDEEGFDDVALMPYAVKYYSNFYEPWRYAAGTGSYGNRPDETLIRSFFTRAVGYIKGRFTDKYAGGATFEDKIHRQHQMDPANTDEAVREVRLDLEEGADIIMIKPALHLDIIYRIKQTFGVPVAAYSVSGEYVMLRTAIDNGTIPSDAILETLLSIKRAGADMIVTYFAKEAAEMLASE